jgi:hypothetical protein
MSARHPNSLLCLAGAALAMLVAAPARAALPDGISGAWFNPAQSGHGLSISLVDEARRAVVIWHVYDPAGAPLTLYIDGVVQGREIVGPAYAPRGMRFGEFDPATVELPEWGEVSLRFDDCRNATLSWDAQAEGYTDGSMAIQPLVSIDSLSCSLPPENPLRPGLYTGLGSREGWAIVDGEGRFWGSELHRSDRVYQRPSFMPSAEVALAQVDELDGGRVAMSMLIGAIGQPRLSLLRGGADDSSVVEIRFPLADAPTSRRWQFGAPARTSLIAPVDLGELAGDYRLPYMPQFFGPRFGAITVDGEGRLCVRYNPEAGEACDQEGRLSTPEGAAGLIDFVIHERNQPLGAPYRGRGWLAFVDSVPTLTLVGTDGETGYLLIGRR